MLEVVYVFAEWNVVADHCNTAPDTDTLMSLHKAPQFQLTATASGLLEIIEIYKSELDLLKYMNCKIANSYTGYLIVFSLTGYILEK